ncbi:MAG: hypothetical protein HN948_06585 [Clostridia bacterium]|jgi:hypothetical protein|nr:hypothetical protein [Clostridia bacterium]MBT7122659.1 hypothetical protein [Clostridia bacterium]
MSTAVSTVLIVIGALVVIIKGVLGKGFSFGRGKFIHDKLGPGAARIITIVLGLLIMTLGILLLIFPEWLGSAE